MHGDFCQAKLFAGQPSYMSDDGYPMAVNDDRLTPTERFNGESDLIDRRLWNLAGVSRVGDDLINRPLFYVHWYYSFYRSQPSMARSGCRRLHPNGFDRRLHFLGRRDLFPEY
jgi:hypothetical protein